MGKVVPPSATAPTETPCSCAMNPRTEKMANPAYIDVPEFMHVTKTSWLLEERQREACVTTVGKKKQSCK